MATNFEQPGEVITFAHTSAVASGEAILIGTKVGVASGAYGADEAGSYAVEKCYRLPKAAAAGEMTTGSAAYFAGGEVTAVDTDAYCGFVAETAAADATTILVKLNA